MPWLLWLLGCFAGFAVLEGASALDGPPYALPDRLAHGSALPDPLPPGGRRRGRARYPFLRLAPRLPTLIHARGPPWRTGERAWLA